MSTAQGAIGRHVAALVGASLLNLVDSVLREQELLPQDQRRGALVVVDEMQTIPGVDFEQALSELGKLADLSPTMRQTLVANDGCLAVFQVSGSDDRDLVWELGRERTSEEDIVSQPVHHCYVRATVERMPAFSVTTRKPDFCDPEFAAGIRREAEAYLTSAEKTTLQQAQRHQRTNPPADKAEIGREEGTHPPSPPPKGKCKKPRSKRASHRARNSICWHQGRRHEPQENPSLLSTNHTSLFLTRCMDPAESKARGKASGSS